MRAIAAVIALAIWCSSAQAQDPAKRGRAIAREFCAPCHAIGKTGTSRDAGAPPFRTLGSNFSLDEFPQRLQQGLSSGHPAMPTFKFKGADARALRAYLRTIQQ